MTVTYSLNVANARLCGFTKLLLRWKGSIYKLLYREILIFAGLYYGLNLSYRYLMNDSQKTVFEKVVTYCKAFSNLIPLSFVLGFYVSIVVTRWWQQYMQIPWPDKAVLLISGYIHGNDERGRIIRRTLARYLLLMQVLTCQAVSTSVRRRFPTLDHIEAVGLFTPEERIAYDQVTGTHGKWWVPAQWFTSLVKRARREGRIKHDILMDRMLEELHAFRSCCGMMFAYDWISIPLVYTQTVTIATYTYFLCTIMSRQYLDPDKGYTSHEVDLYLPVFTILEFFFFMGWLKVAEQLINPYGEDDDDFELNWCLDRNLVISFTIVDDMHNKHPKLVRDAYWDDPEPSLPYTKSSVNLKLNTQPHLGSTINLDVQPEQFLPMQTIMEEDREDYAYTSPPNTADVQGSFAYTQPFANRNMAGTAGNSSQTTGRSATTTNLTNGNNNFTTADVLNNNHMNGPLLNGCAVGAELLDEPLQSVSTRSNSRVGALRKLQERGSRLLHMLGAGSHENVSRMQSNLTMNSVGLDAPSRPVGPSRIAQLSSFLLKTPRKRSRTTSMLESTGVNASSAGTVPGNLLPGPCRDSNPQVNALRPPNRQYSTGPMSSVNELHTIVSQRNSSDATSTGGPSGRGLLLQSRHVHPKLHISLRGEADRKALAGQYGELPSAPVLSSAQRNSGVSPILSRLRNSFNYHANQAARYRNLLPDEPNAFASAMNLQSAQNPHQQSALPTAGQPHLPSAQSQFPADGVSQSGFRFPSAYEEPVDPERYLPRHLIQDEAGLSTKPVEITISPASGSVGKASTQPTPVEGDATKQDARASDLLTQSLILLDEQKDKPISESAPAATGPLSNEEWMSRLWDSSSSRPMQPETRVHMHSLPASRRSSETPTAGTPVHAVANQQITETPTSSMPALQDPPSAGQSERNSLAAFDIDVYEPQSSSSSESLSAYGSNQSTVTSYTELLRKERNANKKHNKK